jgi:hypothetical protein
MIQIETLLQKNSQSESTNTRPLVLTATFIKGKSVLIAFLTAFSLFIITHLVEFPGSVAQLTEVIHGQKTLDLQGSFSSTETYDRLTAFGELGRASYIRTMMTVDLIFPISMFIFFLLFAKYSVQLFRINGIIRRSILSFSIGYVVLDFLENLFIFILLTNFPDRLDFPGTYVGFLTVGKRIFMIGAILIPLGLLVARKVSDLLHKYRVPKIQ